MTLFCAIAAVVLFALALYLWFSSEDKPLTGDEAATWPRAD